MRLNRSRLLHSVLAALLLLWLAMTHALADERREDEGDHERALRAVQRGEALPLSQILARLRPQIDGDIVATEIEEEHDDWVYEVKYIDRAGRLIELLIDARTGQVLGMEED
jgi:uncharacterized membrane protein YkoI